MKYILIFFAAFLAACTNSPKDSTQVPTTEPMDEATEIVTAAIEQSGGDKYENMKLAFDFRDRTYEGYHNDGLFEYVRVTPDSLGEIRDVLNNEGYYRTINGDRVELIDSMAGKYQRSVNSVFYFALLPDGLMDPAVRREHMGMKEINGKNYHKIRVTFGEEGGGDDFQDVFIYWFEEQSLSMDYMAYLYFTDGGGMRFREAINPRRVNGVLFQDYYNFKPSEEMPLDSIDDVYMAGELELLSEILMENIQVTPI